MTREPTPEERLAALPAKIRALVESVQYWRKQEARALQEGAKEKP